VLTWRAQGGVPLPPLPSLSDAEVALLDRKLALDKAWRASPYHLPLPTAKPGAGGTRLRPRSRAGARGARCVRRARRP